LGFDEHAKVFAIYMERYMERNKQMAANEKQEGFKFEQEEPQFPGSPASESGMDLQN